MSYSQPHGYRMPSSASLTSISRALERFGWSTWRAEAIRATGQVAAELLPERADREAVLRRLSRDQVGESDLVISTTHDAGLLLRAAEFLDVAHGILSKPTAVPLPRTLDLRCRAQFLDDPADPQRAWTYLLFGTEHASLEQIFRQLRGIEPYPIPAIDGVSADVIAPDPADHDRRERAATWARVLAPYSRFSPLAISAPEPSLAFDLIESLGARDQDEVLARQGKLTVGAVVADVAERLGDQAPEDLEAVLIEPITN